MIHTAGTRSELDGRRRSTPVGPLNKRALPAMITSRNGRNPGGTCRGNSRINEVSCRDKIVVLLNRLHYMRSHPTPTSEQLPDCADKSNRKAYRHIISNLLPPISIPDLVLADQSYLLALVSSASEVDITGLGIVRAARDPSCEEGYLCRCPES